MRRKLKYILIGLACALLCVGAVCIAAFSVKDKKSTGTVYTTDTEDAFVIERKQYCNILFMGTDREAALCDVIMLLNVDYQNGRVTVAQIPRDTYAEYTSKDYRKLNGAYNTLGSAEQTAHFLSKSLGVEIDHYMCIGLDTLANVVDALGGVDINLPIEMHYSDPEAGLYIDLSAGYNHLDGEKSEHFLRYRSGYIDGDLGRMDAQKIFMAAFFNTLSEQLSPVTVAKLSAAASGVETDMSIADMVAICARVFDMDRKNISMLTLPGTEVRATESGASYYVLSMPATEKIMKDCFFSRSEFDSEYLFRNEKYKSFEEAYNAPCECELLPMEDIINEQLKK